MKEILVQKQVISEKKETKNSENLEESAAAAASPASGASPRTHIGRLVVRCGSGSVVAASSAASRAAPSLVGLRSQGRTALREEPSPAVLSA